MKNSKLSNNLCQDLIIEIFTKLPVKSLLRFRSVSKSLCACIGSPDFIRLYTLRSPDEKLMIAHQFYHKGVDNPFSYIYTLHSESQLSSSPYTNVQAADYPFTGFGVVGSSNGIICLFKTENGISLWNPSTRRKLTAQDRPAWIHTLIPSERRSSYHVFGFGYDAISDDYKILRWTKRDTLEVYSVYTLKTDAWCEIRGPAIHPYLHSCQCLFNGTLHWVAEYKLPIIMYSYHMMTFDLSTGVFSTFPLPGRNWDTSQVTIIKGYLAVISSENANTWIWVRKEESWSVAFKFKTIEINRAYKVLQLSANGDLLLQSLIEGILVHNPETHAQSRLEKFRGSNRVYVMEKYVEGLGLLHMGTSC
uniref:F-box/kelch-repeat protein At3g06240-like n=1 Tax=Erigeron canadensis TaxID=72917 RepID=UPI001CB916E8|nr:F-box/kelch-repeat protein At3g06240-like [Erigeron canadensis]